MKKKTLGTIILFIGLFFIIYGMGILPFSFGITGGEFGFSDKTQGQIEPKNNTDLIFYMTMQHVITGEETLYAHVLGGGTFGFSKNAIAEQLSFGRSILSPYIPAMGWSDYTGFTPIYYAYSSPYVAPCTYNYPLNLVFSDAETFPTVVDWRIDVNANGVLKDFNDIKENYTKYPKYIAGASAFKDYTNGAVIFGIIEKTIPMEVGKDTYVSFWCPREQTQVWSYGYCRFESPLEGTYGTCPPDCRSGWQIQMDKVMHFHFGPCGTEIPEQYLDPLNVNENPEYNAYYDYYETHQCEFVDPDDGEPQNIIPPVLNKGLFIMLGFILGIIGVYLRRRR